MKNKSIFIAIGLLLVNLATVLAQTPRQRYLLSLSKTDHTLAIIDPLTLKVLGSVPVGADPHEIIASSDGKLAFITNTGGARPNEINVIDVVAKRPLTNIDTRPLTGPHGLVFVDGKVWFSAEGTKAVGRYNPATKKIDWIMGTGQDRTHMIYVAPDTKRIYTTNVNAGTVSILVDSLAQRPGLPPGVRPGMSIIGRPPLPIKPSANWIHTVIQVSKGAEGFDVSPDGTQLWTAAADDGIIWIIDPLSKKVTAKIDAHVEGANRLKFTPDGKYVLVSTLRTGDLFIFDVASRKEVKRVALGHGGSGILIDTDGSRAFVACSPDNYVAVIDLKTWEITGKIQIAGPDGLAWADMK